MFYGVEIILSSIFSRKEAHDEQLKEINDSLSSLTENQSRVKYMENDNITSLCWMTKTFKYDWIYNPPCQHLLCSIW